MPSRKESSPAQDSTSMKKSQLSIQNSLNWSR